MFAMTLNNNTNAFVSRATYTSMMVPDRSPEYNSDSQIRQTFQQINPTILEESKLEKVNKKVW